MSADGCVEVLRDHSQLCAQHGQGAPPPGAVQRLGRVGDIRLKRERHSKFPSYTTFLTGRFATGFSVTAALRLT